MLRLVRSLQTPTAAPAEGAQATVAASQPASTTVPHPTQAPPKAPAWGALSERLLNRLDQVEAAQIPTLQPGPAPAPTNRK